MATWIKSNLDASDLATIAHYGVDLNQALSEIASTPPVQPLAWSDTLGATARRLAASARQARLLEARLKAMEKNAFASERQIGGLMRDRARMREELRRLARLINRGLAEPAKPPVRRPRPKPAAGPA